MAEGALAIGLCPHMVAEAGIVPVGEGGRRLGIARQQIEKSAKAIGLIMKAGRQLPQNRAELFPQQQDARSEEIGEGDFDVLEALDMREEAAALHGKDEIIGRGLIPGAVTRRTLERVE